MNGAASFLQVLARKDKSQSRSTGSIITIMFSPKLDSCLRRGYLTSFVCFFEDGSKVSKTRAGSCYLLSNPFPLT